MSSQSELSPRAQAAARLTVATIGPGADTDRLNLLVRQAASLLGAANAQVSMMTDRQVTASVAGPLAEVLRPGGETPFEDTFCATVLRTNASMIVADTAADARVSSVPGVTSGLVGAYAGSPLRNSDGDLVGVLCVFDAAPRPWTTEQLAELDRLAVEVLAELERLEAHLPGSAEAIGEPSLGDTRDGGDLTEL